MCLIFRKNHICTECAKVHYVFYVASSVGLSAVGLFQVELHRFEPRPTCFFFNRASYRVLYESILFFCLLVRTFQEHMEIDKTT